MKMKMPEDQTLQQQLAWILRDPGIKGDDLRYRPVTSLIAELHLCRPASAFQNRPVELSTGFKTDYS